MMPELHPGDKAYIRDSLRDAKSCNSGLLTSMQNMAGQWVTISSIWGTNDDQFCYYIYEDNGYAIWSEDCFDFEKMLVDDEKSPDITELI